jgi:hypothetical protein
MVRELRQQVREAALDGAEGAMRQHESRAMAITLVVQVERPFVDVNTGDVMRR